MTTMAGKRLGRPLGASFAVRPEAIAADAELLRNSGYLLTAADYAKDLRRIADEVESEALSARDDLDRLRERRHAHRKLDERVIAEVRPVGVGHDPRCCVGVVGRFLGVLDRCVHHLRHPSNRTGGGR